MNEKRAGKDLIRTGAAVLCAGIVFSLGPSLGQSMVRMLYPEASLLLVELETLFGYGVLVVAGVLIGRGYERLRRASE